MSVGLRIGEVADHAGVSVQTLRYYERRGLVTPSHRRHSGHRTYGADAIGLVRMIKAAQRLGFTLSEIEELIKLASHRAGGTRTLRERAADKIEQVNQKISQLEAVRDALASVFDADCDSLIDCSCGLGCPIPDLQITTIGDSHDNR
ncbi:MAG TPA: MerR family transcriptional regulator [Egibacteraceae bacterium]|nr:MerR family transcriptional regulator [Egibacteraceae bacterium]